MFKFKDIEGILNHDLMIISAWAKQWLVNFNPQKTIAMLFSLMKPETIPRLIFDGVSINFVDQHKHLGVTLTDNGKWQNHIENIMASASKVMGVMRKLKYTFSRIALNQIYISYARPILEYSSIVWDNCTVEQSNSLEKQQNEAAPIVTGLTRSVSLERLYAECGWDSLALRRGNQKLKFMYKVSDNMAPSYIAEMIPPTVGDSTPYSLRNRANISMIPQRTAIFSQSCIPSSIAAWNNMPMHYRNSQSYDAFCYQVKKDYYSNIKVPAYYLKGKRRQSVLHCRIRNFCSNLHSDLFHNHLRDSPFCDCLEEIEDAEHYFFRCRRFIDQRLSLFHKTQHLHPLNTNLLLSGNINISYNDNVFLFEAVQKYIKDTARFDT